MVSHVSFHHWLNENQTYFVRFTSTSNDVIISLQWRHQSVLKCPLCHHHQPIFDLTFMNKVLSRFWEKRESVKKEINVSLYKYVTHTQLNIFEIGNWYRVFHQFWTSLVWCIVILWNACGRCWLQIRTHTKWNLKKNNFK